MVDKIAVSFCFFQIFNAQGINSHRFAVWQLRPDVFGGFRRDSWEIIGVFLEISIPVFPMTRVEDQKIRFIQFFIFLELFDGDKAVRTKRAIN
ncbi:hypothetical protein D3C75_1047960 [compost metagenome]